MSVRRSALVALLVVLLLGLASCGLSIEITNSPGIPRVTPGPLPRPTQPTPDQLTSYTMAFQLDPDAKRLTGTVDVVTSNTSSQPWAELCFRDWSASVLAIDGAPGQTSGVTAAEDTATGKALVVRVDESDNSLVFVELLTPLGPGETTEVRLTYHTDVPGGDLRLSWQERPAGKLIFDFGNFYPILGVFQNGDWIRDPYVNEAESFYSPCADYSVTLTLPDDYVVAASGDETKGTPSGGRVTWTITAGNMRDFAMSVGNGLDRLTRDVGDTSVNSYFFPDDPQSRRQAERSLDSAAISLPEFTAAFGPYPYDELDIVQSALFAGGMEYPSLVRISTHYLADSDPTAVMHVVAHEIGHQWFYAVVGNNEYREPWLDESFATYCSDVVFLTAYESAESVEATFRAYEKSPMGRGQFYLNRSVPDFGGSYYDVYMRGALFLYKLRAAMGSEVFTAMMREYYAAYSFKVATTSDFVRMVARAAPGNRAVSDLITANFKL